MTPFNALSSCPKRSEPTQLTENDSETPRGRNYSFDSAVDAAVDVAIGLGRPLLVAGEPGCGKTELGYAVARRMGIETLYFFAVKSSSEAGDLFYSYDAVGRFRKAQLAAFEAQSLRDQGKIYVAPEVGDFIKYEALGRAILDAHPKTQVAHLMKGAKHKPLPETPRRSVVVIDEIDKAPRDFTNDLLREIEDMSFRVAELEGDESQGDATPSGAKIRPELRPIIFITSNEESQLPDAFLRRCAFLAIEFPKEERLREILDLHFNRTDGDAGLGENDRKILVTLFNCLRQSGLQKRPGIAELIDAARVLRSKPSKTAIDAWLNQLAPALIKLKSDLSHFPRALEMAKAAASERALGGVV